MQAGLTPEERYDSLPGKNLSSTPKYIFKLNGGSQVFVVIDGWWELCTVTTVPPSDGDFKCTVTCRKTTSGESDVIVSVDNIKDLWPCAVNIHPYDGRTYTKGSERGPWDQIYALTCSSSQKSPANNALRSSNWYESQHGRRQEPQTHEDRLQSAIGPDVFIKTSLSDLYMSLPDGADRGTYVSATGWDTEMWGTERWLNFRALSQTAAVARTADDPRYAQDFRKDMYLDLFALPPNFDSVSFTSTTDAYFRENKVLLRDRGECCPRLLECILSGDEKTSLQDAADADSDIGLENLLTNSQRGREYSIEASKRFGGRRGPLFSDGVISQCVMGKYAFKYLTWESSDIAISESDSEDVEGEVDDADVASRALGDLARTSDKETADTIAAAAATFSQGRKIFEGFKRTLATSVAGGVQKTKDYAAPIVNLFKGHPIQIEYADAHEGLCDWAQMANSSLIQTFLCNNRDLCVKFTGDADAKSASPDTVRELYEQGRWK